MGRITLWLLTGILLSYPIHGQSNMRQCPESIIKKSLEAMGGENKLKSLKTIHYNTEGFRNLAEQSERPEGPLITGVEKYDVIKDFENNKMSYTFVSGASFLSGVGITNLVDGNYAALKTRGAIFPVDSDNLGIDQMDLSPPVVLFTALHSNVLICEKDTILQNSNQKVIRFVWKNYPVRIFINSNTNLITAVEVVKPYTERFLDIWGDSKKISYYSFWYLLPNGVHFPMQEDIYMNGQQYRMSLIDWTNISINIPVPADSLSIPDSVKAKVPSLTANRQTAIIQLAKSQTKEIEKDIWLIPGPCVTAIINQDDGLVILEASQSSDFSKLIIQRAGELYPGRNIKAVISTSDAWLHMGGVREYAAGNFKLFCLDLNKPIINKLLHANYSTHPDTWQQKKDKTFSLHAISKKTVIGTGSNRIELYPFRTETGERMMMVYFPGHKIIYASDLFQPKNRNGKYWNSHYTLEVIQAIEREGLEVEKLFAMHSAIVNYSDIIKDFK